MLPVPPPALPSPTRPPRALVVSAVDLAVDLGQTALWQGEASLAFATDAESAWQAVSAGPFAMVIVDAGLAGAVDLVSRLRADPESRNCAIVALSRAPARADEPAFREAGANAVLTPPVDPAVWDARLRELLLAPPR